MIDIEQKSKELKEYVSQYDTKYFLGDIVSLIHFISVDNPTSSLKGLSSPLRQLYYVAALNLTSKVDPDKPLVQKYSDKELEHIKSLLIEIETGYEQFFYPKEDDEIDEDWKLRRQVAMPTFLDYFNQGPLNYDEQVIERVSEYFSPLNKEIQAKLGLDVQEFIDFYNFLDSIPNKFLNEKINKKEGQQSWGDFCNSMDKKGLMPWEWQEHLPEQYKNLFQYMDDQGSMYRFSKQSLIDKFGAEKTDLFLKALVCERKETKYLYYTERNILHSKPIFKVSDDEYQTIGMTQIIHAIYNILMDTCISFPDEGEKFYKVRGKLLEVKIEKIFQTFFNQKAFVYKGYFTQEKHEQDLLFLISGLTLIVEAKASKRDEPLREPDKAYPLILQNFNATIQKGYDQAYRVKSKFIQKKILNIYRDEKLTKHVIDINTKNYHNAFSIVVTLERFGQIQTNLSELLEIYDDDEFPLSICVDDLEIVLLLMKKKGKKISDLIQYLKQREKLHGRLICSDETEIFGGFITNKITKEQINSDELLLMHPSFSDIFDTTYQTEGLGFDKEKNLEVKTSGRYLPLGGF